ncbi:MAG: hypothetical protein JXJ19_08285 [Elusimicrobia bacterium]|nr:hypothetical protein [Elusimicrobiota bacterium]
MGIRSVQKTFIVCLSEERDILLRNLQLWGNMELINIHDSREDSQEDLISEKVSKLRFITDMMSSLSPKEPLLKRLREGLPQLSPEQLKGIAGRTDIDGDYERLREIDRSNKQAESRIEELHRKIQYYESVKFLDFSQKDTEFRRTGVIIAKIPEEQSGLIRDEGGIYAGKFTGEGGSAYIFIFDKDDRKRVEEMLSKTDYAEIRLPYDRIPADEILALEEDIDELRKELEKNMNETKGNYLSRLPDYRVLLDMFENEDSLIRETEKIYGTKYTSVISGWIPRDAEKDLEKTVKKSCSACHITFQSPGRDDRPPVILNNGSFNRPFEVVTNLYGTPDYGWIDPTPYCAPFFVLFFGLCLTDAGYGIIMAALCIWAVRKLKLAEGARKFMMLLFWGNIASVIAGVLTGGWFGNIFASVKAIDGLKLFDPLEKPQYFLYFSVLLGYIQVLFGVSLSAVKKIREKETIEGINDISWIMILLALPVCMAVWIFNAGVPHILFSLCRYLLFICIAEVVLFTERNAGNILLRVAGGLYKLYGGTDYFKDIISYSRLFALGVGTAILGMAVNEMSAQAAAIKLLGIPVGYFVAAVIFVFGHVLNILMSLLSGYIHTSRLQYVEFFKWFFRGGGRVFAPLSWKNKRAVISR